jgi:hypothetical protein
MSTKTPRVKGFLTEIVKQAKLKEKMIVYRVFSEIRGEKKLVEGIIGEIDTEGIYLWHNDYAIEQYINSQPGTIKPTTKYCLRLEYGHLNELMQAELYETEESKPRIIPINHNANNRESLLLALKINENN